MRKETLEAEKSAFKLLATITALEKMAAVYKFRLEIALFADRNTRPRWIIKTGKVRVENESLPAALEALKNSIINPLNVEL
jgi:hypothetical protein